MLDIAQMERRNTKAIGQGFWADAQPYALIIAAHVGAVVVLAVGLLLGRSQLFMTSAMLFVAAFALFRLSLRGSAARASGPAETVAASPVLPAADQQAMTLDAQLQHDLSGALGHGELRLVYQPLARLSSGKTIGYEALLRWDHPQYGLIMPTRFVEAAETSGLIVPVGAWVMHEACREAANWDNGLFVSVNASAVQITAPGFVDMVRAALSDSGLSPARLEIEVTETAMIDDSGTARDTLKTLRDMGIRIALDDFGMGHASFAYLLAFPFDKIKIDRKFISEISWRPESRTIVEAVAGMAHKLGIEVLAEGIEEVDQLVIAKLAGCELGQGLLLGEPRPANEHYRLRAKAAVRTVPEFAVAA